MLGDGGTMPLTLRPRVIVLSLCLALGATTCKKKEDPATAATKQALEQVKVQVAKLRKEAADLRARANTLPENVPSIEAARAKLLSVEEVLGTEAARVEWMAGEYGAALASGSKQKADEVAKTIQDSVEGSKRLAKPI